MVKCEACGEQWTFAGLESTAPYAADDASTLVVRASAGARSGVQLTVGHFELLAHVGHGSYGDVWRARDTKLDRIVAVKIPRRGDLSESEAEYFLREARAAAQLKHPNIVGVHEAGDSDGTLFIVSDFVEGESLKERLAERRLTTRESIELAIKIADALHHAHEAGVVHRDLKPGNIMLNAAGEPLVMDFGLAKRDSGEVTMTMEGNVLGTPAYMSPEQARGEGHTADRRADIYSLGVMLFEFLTGERPFRGDARMLIVQIANDLPPSPRKLDSRVPRDLETICVKCLETEPTRRFATAADLADELRRWLEGKPLVSRPVGVAGRFMRWCRRRPLVATLSIACAILALVVLIGGPILYVKERIARGDAQNALAQNAFDAARLAGERGKWRTALQYLDEAEQAGFADSFELGRLRIRASRSIADFAAWSREIDRLKSVTKTNEQTAQFLIIQAEQLRFQGKGDEGLRLIRKALTMKLPAADAAYAKGLLANTTPEAAKFFQQAVDADPTFHEATSSLVATLVMLGRLKDADLRARVAHQLFPDDPSYLFWLAIVATLREDKREKEIWTDRLSDQLESRYARFVRNALVDLEKVIKAILLLKQPQDGANSRLMEAWFELGRIQAEARKENRNPKKMYALVTSLRNSIPPAINRAIAGFGQLNPLRLPAIQAGQDLGFNQAVENLTRVHPECTMLWLHAGTLVQRGDLVGGSEALFKASQLPSVIPGVKPLSMYLAAVARDLQFQKTGNRADSVRAVEMGKRRIPMGPLSDEEAGLLLEVGSRGWDVVLMRAVVANRLEQNPNDRKWLYHQMEVEAAVGNDFRIMALADRILRQFPNDGIARVHRKLAARRAARRAVRLPRRLPAVAVKPKPRKRSK